MRRTIINFSHIFIVVSLASLILGCSSTGPKSASNLGTAEKLYKESSQLISDDRLAESHSKLKAMEIRFPFHDLTHALQLDLAMAYSQHNETSKAVSLANRFIAQYPYHQNADYAYYIKAVANFNSGVKKLTSDSQQDLQQANTREAREAYKNFSDLIRRFPTSEYTPESQSRITHLRDLLSTHEVKLAESEFKNSEITMASQRARYVIKNYPDTSASNQAQALLDRMHAKPNPSVLIIPATEAPEIILKEPDIAAVEPIAKTTSIESLSIKPKIKREEWLLAQQPNHFTIQVTGTSQEQSLNDFIHDKRLNDNRAAYYLSNRQGKTWFTALYGTFTSYTQAKEKVEELENSIGIKGLWIRRFRDVQGQINSYATINP